MNEKQTGQNLDIAVIVGGIFGCLISIELARSGYVVNLYEKNPSSINVKF